MMDAFVTPNSPVFIVLFAWSLLWKGIALWRASKYDQRNWFIVLLVVNTAGILEIIYLFRFAKKRLQLHELRFWEKPHHS
ncbi:MAG: hypothetical protein HYV40_05730 [Candidatus Levybacteria bacterium]|nr:hypothetical protein [Candidatus Levybacteria bacterium]